MFALTKLILLLPYSIAWQVIYFLCGRISFVVTNVFGPTQPLYANGSKSLKMQVFLPPLVNMPGGYAIVSHLDTVKVSFTSDEAKCAEPQVVIQLFEKAFDSFLNE